MKYNSFRGSLCLNSKKRSWLLSIMILRCQCGFGTGLIHRGIHVKAVSNMSDTSRFSDVVIRGL